MADVARKATDLEQLELAVQRVAGSVSGGGGGGGTGLSDAPRDGEAYARVDGEWQALNNLSETVNVGIADAPNDGKVYVRTDSAWEVGSLETIATGIADAPNDGNIYVRVNGAWQLLDSALASA